MWQRFLRKILSWNFSQKREIILEICSGGQNMQLGRPDNLSSFVCSFLDSTGTNLKALIICPYSTSYHPPYGQDSQLMLAELTVHLL